MFTCLPRWRKQFTSHPHLLKVFFYQCARPTPSHWMLHTLFEEFWIQFRCQFSTPQLQWSKSHNCQFQALFLMFWLEWFTSDTHYLRWPSMHFSSISINPSQMQKTNLCLFHWTRAFMLLSNFTNWNSHQSNANNWLIWWRYALILDILNVLIVSDEGPQNCSSRYSERIGKLEQWNRYRKYWWFQRRWRNEPRGNGTRLIPSCCYLSLFVVEF